MIAINEEGRGVGFVTHQCLQGAESLPEFRGTRAFALIQTGRVEQDSAPRGAAVPPAALW